LDGGELWVNMQSFTQHKNSVNNLNSSPTGCAAKDLSLSDRQDPPRTFADLLERAGFHIRGRRADCPHCQAEGRGHGHGRGTVSFTDEVAFCHRCKWTRNIRTLSRELRVPVAPETHERREARDRAALFSEWVNTCHMILVRRLHRLTERAELAKKVLRQLPDFEPAWGALADLYHSRSSILGALDTLVFEKVSPCLEEPMTRESLALAFNDAVARVGFPDGD
jgi:hypothetical protein